MRINPNGNLGQVWEGNVASTPQERKSIFGRARYDLTDNLTAFAQLTYSNNTVKTNQATISPAITVWQAHVPSDGRALPPALQALLNARPDTTEDWRLFRGVDFWQEAASVDNSNDVYQLTVGLEGGFANNDLTWEFNPRAARPTRATTTATPSLQRYRWMNALPAFGAGDATGLPGQPGNSIGQAGVPPVNAGSSAGHHVFGREYVLDCSSGLPVFGGFQNLDPECLDSIDSRSKAASTLTQDIFEFNLQGKIADMRSGELRFAAGVAQRDNTFRFEPLNDNRVVSDHPVGLFVSTTPTANGREGDYGELLMPLTSRFEPEFGYRYSSSTRRPATSTPEDAVRPWRSIDARAAASAGDAHRTRRRCSRADHADRRLRSERPMHSRRRRRVTSHPTRGGRIQQLCIDLIGNPNTPFGGTWGPPPPTPRATRCVFPLENVLRGAPDLIAETADTWTFGVVFNGPGSLENLTASIDMYNIEMTDAIARMNPVFIYEQCFNANGVSNPTLSENDPGGFCSMIGRQPITGERDTVQTPFVNQGALQTSGVDLAVNWALDLDNGGTFSINSVASVLNEYLVQDAPTEPFREAKGTLAEGGQYEYRLNSTFGYAGAARRTSAQWPICPRSQMRPRSRSRVTRSTTGCRHSGIDNLPTDPPSSGAIRARTHPWVARARRTATTTRPTRTRSTTTFSAGVRTSR
jgi:hypothetical protein